MLRQPVTLLLFSVARGAVGNVYQYQNQALQPNVVQYRRVGMWAPMAHESPSFISIDLKFSRPDARRSGLIQALVFNSVHLSSVGAPATSAASADGSSGRTFCCTSTLKAQGVPGCERVGRIVLKPDATKHDGHVWSRDVPFGQNESSGSLSVKVPIRRTLLK